jgi:endonuclease/exonuclease/phosphatase (EEP) superfamily protein YafD
MDLSGLPSQVISWASNLAWFLLISFSLSLLARFHSVFELFSHFTIQYAVGGFILAALLLLMHQYWLAGLCAFVMLFSIAETRWLMHDPLLFTRPAAETNFTVMQYNKLFRNDHFPQMRRWFEQNAAAIDVLIVQESGVRTIEELEQFKDFFPNQYPADKKDRFNDVSILSRYPFEVTKIPLSDRPDVSWFTAAASRIEIKKPGVQPIIIYSFHTQVPLGPTYSSHRNGTLRGLANAVKNEKSELVIASGDWNITPYSPYFGDFLKTSGLNYQNYRLLPETTWASHFLFPFLKIPIDHVLYNDRLTLTDIKRGPAMGSDHHSLIASFNVPEKE